MVTAQSIAASMSLLNRAALIQGMKPPIFVVYRQATATVVLAPIAFLLSLRREWRLSMDIRSFVLITACSFFGAVLNQNFYAEGLYYANTSVGTAMSNLIPAITFLLAIVFRLEKVNIRSMSSIAKIIGTVVCVGGAIAIALLKGPKLLNHVDGSAGSRENYDWLIGCLFFLANTSSWSLWLILLVPASKSYPDSLSLAAWVCFLSTLQAAVVALVLEKDPNDWRISSTLELSSILFSGVAGSGVILFLQSWCVSKCGPLYSAMFSPLSTVIATIYASIFFHEEMYIGSLLGSIAVISGLYIVLWGKAQEVETKRLVEDMKTIATEDSILNDLEQTLLDDSTAIKERRN